MTKKKVVKVRISDLNINHYVREHLDEERAFQFGLLLEAGSALGPISITPDNQVIDGRHRIAAYELNGIDDIDAHVEEVDSEQELIAKAYRANSGGSKPPTEADNEHTVRCLLQLRTPQKNIAELLGLPPSIAKRYISRIQSKIKRKKLLDAAREVTDNDRSITEASALHEVKPEELSDFMGGGKKRKKVSRIADFKRQSNTRFRALGAMNSHAIRSLIAMYDDGDASKAEVDEFFDRLRTSLKKSAKTVEEWEGRFRYKVNGEESSV